jgi:hypothetical protein
LIIFEFMVDLPSIQPRSEIIFSTDQPTTTPFLLSVSSEKFNPCK